MLDVCSPGLLVRQGALDGLVQNNSDTARKIYFCCDSDRCDMPSVAPVDQQRGPAHPAGSSAAVPQKEPTASIDKARADPASSIRHQNKRMILLIAAEHDACPVFR